MPTPRPLLDELAFRATQRRAFNAVLTVACPAHGAKAHEPCWTIEKSSPQDSIGLCGARIQRAKCIISARRRGALR